LSKIVTEFAKSAKISFLKLDLPALYSR